MMQEKVLNGTQSLTSRVLAYQRDGHNGTGIRNELSVYVYRYPLRKYSTLDEDAAGDFYLFCEAKLERLMDRVRNHGKPFELGLNSVLSWQLETFLSRRQRSDSAWWVGLQSPVWCDGVAGFALPAKCTDLA